jgi:regulator of replication initiation timing
MPAWSDIISKIVQDLSRLEERVDVMARKVKGSRPEISLLHSEMVDVKTEFTALKERCKEMIVNADEDDEATGAAMREVVADIQHAADHLKSACRGLRTAFELLWRR